MGVADVLIKPIEEQVARTLFLVRSLAKESLRGGGVCRLSDSFFFFLIHRTYRMRIGIANTEQQSPSQDTLHKRTRSHSQVMRASETCS